MLFGRYIAEKLINAVAGHFIGKMVAGFWGFMTGKAVAKDNRQAGRLEQQNADLQEEARLRVDDDEIFRQVEGGEISIKDDL
jgi:predicted RNase H-like nuclease